MAADLQSNILWTEVRKADSYIDIVEASNEWLSYVFPRARQLKFAPVGKRVSDRCPKIKVTNCMAYDCVGSFYAHDVYHGPAIRVVNARRMLCEGPLFLTLRETILHESQHAYDDQYGIYSVNHGHWFDKRLTRLREVFPPSSLL